MTVNELITALKQYPPGMNVKICIMPTIANATSVDTSIDMDTNITSVVVRSNELDLETLVAKASQRFRDAYKEVVTV